MDSDPMIINSLLFEKGSEQPVHIDTYHVPAPNGGKLAVSAICLEDEHPDAVPVNLYLGSYKIPLYVFSNGEIRLTDKAEAPEATKYVEDEISRRGLKKVPFVGKKGDVVFRHGQLYRGGSKIKNHNLTRKTLVTHYLRSQDLIRKELLKLHSEGGYYMNHQYSKPW